MNIILLSICTILLLAILVISIKENIEAQRELNNLLREDGITPPTFTDKLQAIWVKFRKAQRQLSKDAYYAIHHG